MKLIKVISFCALFLAFLVGISLAQTGSPRIKITEPKEGSIVIPGQEITVTVESVGGFVIKEGFVGVARFLPEKQITSLPATLTLTIPNEAIGEVAIIAFGYAASGKLASSKVTLNVQQTATLQSLEINQDEIFIDVDWNGNIKGKSSDNFVTIYGIYSDGVKRILDDEPNTSYTSSDTSVISVDNKGNWQLHKVAPATITISNSGVSKVIPVVFQKPTGIKPLETIPPTTQMDIQPQPNSAGWNSSDITITINAQDNEGGSGISEISYQFPKLSAKSTWVEDNQAIIPFSKEGIYLFRYGARDKERNSSGQQTIEIRLDKTPPVININANPNILWPPNHKMVDIKISGSATDSLSGVALTSFKVTDEYGQIKPVISKFGDTIKLEAWREGKDLNGRTYTISVTAKDKAGNESRSSTTVICPHDQREKLSK